MSIRGNLVYSALLTMSTYLVPLLVFPYISRVLGADGIGIVDTVDRISRLSFYDINYKVTSSREKRSGKTVKMVRIIA